MWTQCVANIPTSIVPIHPGMIPVCLKAAGIASSPDPKDDLRRWKNEPMVLKLIFRSYWINILLVDEIRLEVETFCTILLIILLKVQIIRPHILLISIVKSTDGSEVWRWNPRWVLWSYLQSTFQAIKYSQFCRPRKNCDHGNCTMRKRLMSDDYYLTLKNALIHFCCISTFNL